MMKKNAKPSTNHTDLKEKDDFIKGGRYNRKPGYRCCAVWFFLFCTAIRSAEMYCLFLRVAIKRTSPEISVFFHKDFGGVYFSQFRQKNYFVSFSFPNFFLTHRPVFSTHSSINAYAVGTMTSVRKVETVSPKIIATASGRQKPALSEPVTK